MGSDLNVCANIIRVILVIVNILFVCLGAVLIGVGSWLIAIDDDYSFITGSGIISGAALLIIAGIVTVVICATGIFGAIFKLRPILVVYAVVVLIIVILEIAAGILGFVFRDRVVEEVRDGSLNAIRLYSVNLDSANSSQRDATNAVDFFQNTFDCCGYNNASDWLRENFNALLNSNLDPKRPPGDGCVPCDPSMAGCTTYSGEGVDTGVTFTITFNATTTGCINTIEDNVILISSVTGAIGIVFGILEIVGILFALFLCCCITSARKQEVV